jgi:hypothetical protein
VVATRRSGELPPHEEPVSEINGLKETPRTRKRKSIEITSTAENEEEDDEAPEVVSSSVKRRRTGKTSRTPTKKLEIRTKSTRPVVEIPFMDPIPTSKLSPIPAPELSKVEEDVSKAVDQIEELERDHDEPVAAVATIVSIAIDQNTQPKEGLDEPVSVAATIISKTVNQVEEPEVVHDESVHIVASNSFVTKSPEPPTEQPVIQSTPTSTSPKNTTQRAAPSKHASLPSPAKTLAQSDFLPEEFLEDDEEDEENGTLSNAFEAARPLVKAKKTIFEDFVRVPKDRRIGSTTYKVTKAKNLNLTPTSSTWAKSTKEAWLHGRVGAKFGNNRKAISKGFFVSKK